MRKLSSFTLVALAVLMLAAQAQASPILTVESANLAPGGGTFTLHVSVDNVSNLFADQMDANVTPLDGQPAGTLTYVNGLGADIILIKNWPGLVFTVQQPDGYAATLLTPATPVSGSDEPLGLLTFQYTPGAYGEYRIDLVPDTALVSGTLGGNGVPLPIPFSVEPGYVTIPEPATLSVLLFGGMVALPLRRR